MNGGAVLVVRAVVAVRLADLASETKVANSTDTHFVYQNIFKFDVSVDISCNFVQVSYTPDDLAKHHASVIRR